MEDAAFEKVVMDKAYDVFVLFYHKTAAFCRGNGTAYAEFAEQLSTTPTVRAEHMDVKVHKSPFVFEDVRRRTPCRAKHARARIPRRTLTCFNVSVAE